LITSTKPLIRKRRLSLDSGKVLFLSDIHLGSRTFVAQDELLDLLERLATDEGLGHLVLLGDIFDFQHSSEEMVIEQSRDFMQKLYHLSSRGIGVDYVVGNHDLPFLERHNWVSDNFGIPETMWEVHYAHLHLQVESKLFHLEHGHLHDPSFKKHRELYQLISETFGPIADNWPGLKDWLGRLYKKLHLIREIITPSSDGYIQQYEGAFNEFKIAAARILFEEDCQYVCFGHTHRPYLREFLDDKTYVNTGCWTRYRTCMVYDPRDDNFTWFEHGRKELISLEGLELLLGEVPQSTLANALPS